MSPWNTERYTKRESANKRWFELRSKGVELESSLNGKMYVIKWRTR